MIGTLNRAARTLTFQWTDNADNEDAFKVLVTSQFGDFVAGQWLVANTVTYVVPNIGGTIYCIEVTVTNFFGQATVPKTCINLIYLLPVTPSNFSATFNGWTTLHLTWTDNSDNEDAFIIFGNTVTTKLPANSTSYDVALQPEHTYCFSEIRALNVFGTSINGAPLTNLSGCFVTPAA